MYQHHIAHRRHRRGANRHPFLLPRPRWGTTMAWHVDWIRRGRMSPIPRREHKIFAEEHQDEDATPTKEA